MSCMVRKQNAGGKRPLFLLQWNETNMPTPNTTPEQQFEDVSTSRPGKSTFRKAAYSEKSVDAIRAALDGMDERIDAEVEGRTQGLATLPPPI